MWAGILSGLMKLLGVFEKLLTKHYSEQNVLREGGARVAEIQDEAEEAARKAGSQNEDEKQAGIKKMRDLISE